MESIVEADFSKSKTNDRYYHSRYHFRYYHSTILDTTILLSYMCFFEKKCIADIAANGRQQQVDNIPLHLSPIL